MLMFDLYVCIIDLNTDESFSIVQINLLFSQLIISFLADVQNMHMHVYLKIAQMGLFVININTVCGLILVGLLVWEIGRQLEHYSDHPHPRVVDRGSPSRMGKRVAPDKEGAADKQCLEEGKLLFQTGADGARLVFLGIST